MSPVFMIVLQTVVLAVDTIIILLMLYVQVLDSISHKYRYISFIDSSWIILF